MRVSEQEHASQGRMSTVAGEIHRAIDRILDQVPGLTHVELAYALIDVAQRQLMHQRRAEVSEDEDEAPARMVGERHEEGL